MWSEKAKKIQTALFFVASAVLLHSGHILNSDEGVILNGAWKMFNGKRLYLDFFSYVAPGSYLLTNLSFHLFGPSYWAAKFVSLLLLLVSTYALYGIAMFFSNNRKLSLATAWAWLLLSAYGALVLINHNTQSTYVALIGIYFLLKAAQSTQKTDYFLGGLFIGMVTLFLQTKGIILALCFGGLMVYCVARKKIVREHLLVFIGGAVAIPLSSLFIWQPYLLYENLFAWPHVHYLAVNRVSYFPIAAVILLFMGLARWVWVRRVEINRDVIVVLAVSQLAAFLSILNRPDTLHIVWSSFGLLIFGLYALYEFYRQPRVYAIFKKFSVAEALVAILISFPIALNISSFSSTRALLDKISSYHMQQFYAHPFLAGLYFELQIPDPYPYDVLLTGMHPQAAFLSNLGQLIAHDPDYVVLQYGMAQKFDYSQNNALDRYISAHYEYVDQAPPLWIMKKRSK